MTDVTDDDVVVEQGEYQAPKTTAKTGMYSLGVYHGEKYPTEFANCTGDLYEQLVAAARYGSIFETTYSNNNQTVMINGKHITKIRKVPT